MNGWRVTTLGEFIDVKHGFAFKGEYFSEQGKYVVLTPGNFHEVGGFKLRPGKDRYYLGEIPQDYILNKGDMIVAMTEQAEGLLGSAAMIPAQDVYLHNQRLGLIKVKPLRADKRYLYYIFNTSAVRQQIRGSSSGTKIRHTSPERIRSVNIFAPRLHVQKKIAAILSTYDDLIENNQRRIALLEKMAEEIYREWFVRMRFPGHKQVKFEKDVPEGWEYKELNKLCRLIKRGISPKYDDESKSLVINQRCIRDGNIDLSVARGHETKIPKEKMIQYGDVLINSTGVGTLGRVSVLEYEVANLTCDTHVTICRADSNLVNVHFLAHTVKRLQSHFENMAIGSTGQTELGREMVANTKVLLPTLAIQNAFSEQAAEIWKMKRYLSGMLKTLEQTRDSLLPRLISGKLSVENLDIQFPTSMRETGHDQ